MDNTSQQALIPLEQAIIVFHGNEILAVHLPDDRIGATLSSLCAILGILPHGQIQRIRRDKDLAEHLLHALVETSSGLQLMDVLIDEHIPDWVMGLQLKRIAPEKRPLILALKVEIVDALHSRFFGGQAAQPTSESRAEPDFPEQSARSRSRAVPISSWDQLLEGLDDVQEALYDIGQEEQAKTRKIALHDEWLQSLDKRLAASGQGSAATLGWTPLLSAAHLADAQALLRSLERVTGRVQSRLEQEMLETFRVTAINAIPDEQWQDILDWCIWRARQPQERERSDPT